MDEWPNEIALDKALEKTESRYIDKALGIDELWSIDGPKTVYHYSSISSCISILQSDQFWASQIQFLNDKSEHEHAMTVARDTLSDVEKSTSGIGSDFAKEATRYLNYAEKNPVYVVSFSEIHDDLSQWRSYTGEGPGFSIGVSSHALMRHGPKSRKFGRCIYDRERQVEVIRNLVHIFTQDLAHYFPYFEVGQINHDLKTFRAKAFCMRLAEIAPFFKHPAFEAEKEWRLVIFDTRPPSFRTGNSGIIPFLKEDVSSCLGANLQKIVVKPVRDPDFLQCGLERLLKAIGCDPREMVTRSTIPYREKP